MHQKIRVEVDSEEFGMAFSIYYFELLYLDLGLLYVELKWNIIVMNSVLFALCDLHRMISRNF